MTGNYQSNLWNKTGAWYRIYKTIENDAAVRQVHRDYLLLRDYTALSAVFMIFYGAAGLYVIASMRTAMIYMALLIAQYAVARQAAANYGVRMVTTVLARCTAKEADGPKAPVKTITPESDCLAPGRTGFTAQPAAGITLTKVKHPDP